MGKELFFLMIISVLFSCKSNKFESSIPIIIDIDKANIVSLEDKSQIISVINIEQSNKDCLMGLIKNLYILDSAYIFFSLKKLIKFDKSGEFLYNISRKGRASNEYVDLWESWIEGDTLYIYDMNSDKILLYSVSNDFIRSINLSGYRKNHFQYLIPVNSGEYVGKVVYNNKNGCPELALYDKAFNYIKRIGDLSLTSGINLGYAFEKFKDEIIYWRPLENYIYSIDNNYSLKIKYIINFLNKNLPDYFKYRDDYDRIDMINRDITKYASVINDLKETDNNLMFTFLFNTQKYLSIYNKKNKSGSVVLFKSKNKDSKISAIKYFKENIFAVLEDKNDDNFSLYLVSL